jgi:hypothetical protein
VECSQCSNCENCRGLTNVCNYVDNKPIKDEGVTENE